MGTQIINRTERLSTIERMLSRNASGLRVVEIARACGVDRRTIYRDLALLTQVGLPIYQKEGRFFINHDYYLGTMRLNLNEAIALFLATRTLSRHSDHQNPHVVSALAKLSMVLSEPIAAHVTFMSDTIRGNAVDRGFVSILETITRAWSERQKLKLWYSLGGSTAITVHHFATYFLEPVMNSGLYAVGFDELSRCVRPFKLQWVRRVKLLPENYEIPNGFDPRPHLASAWGIMDDNPDGMTRVVLAFSADVTPLIKERIWHNSQQIQTLADKRCTLNVHVANWREMLPWILSWGGQVEVLEPHDLREALAEEAARVAAIYPVAVGN
jgi:predicted DNA-binding transcriptional regulator YafY